MFTGFIFSHSKCSGKLASDGFSVNQEQRTSTTDNMTSKTTIILCTWMHIVRKGKIVNTLCVLFYPVCVLFVGLLFNANILMGKFALWKNRTDVCLVKKVHLLSLSAITFTYTCALSTIYSEHLQREYFDT
jgi:hypothetical protein